MMIDHIDGTSFRVVTTQGEVIKPGDKKIIPGKGMPFYQTPYRYGNLVLEFKIDIPKTITKSQLAILRKNLKVTSSERPLFIEEPLLMKKFSNSTANPNPHGGKEHYRIQNDEDSDSDENPTLPG